MHCFECIQTFVRGKWPSSEIRDREKRETGRRLEEGEMENFPRGG